MKYIKILVACMILSCCITSCNQSAEVSTTVSDKDVVLSNIHARTSIRKYVANKEVTKEDVETLLKAGMAAPSGKNKQPWQFVVINDREVLTKMSEELPTAKILAQAPMAIVVCGDSAISSYWYLDCALASQNILLAAQAMSLGATYTASYPYEERMAVVRKYVNIPENMLPLNIIPIGHPEGENKPKDKFDVTKIHYNKW